MPLVHGDDARIVTLGTPLLLAPDAAGVGPFGGVGTLLEEALPGLGVALGQRLVVVDDLEQPPARGAVVDDVKEGVAPLTPTHTLEPGPVRLHGVSFDGDSQSAFAVPRGPLPPGPYTSSGPAILPMTALAAATAGPAR